MYSSRGNYHNLVMALVYSTVCNTISVFNFRNVFSPDQKHTYWRQSFAHIPLNNNSHLFAPRLRKWFLSVILLFNTHHRSNVKIQNNLENVVNINDFSQIVRFPILHKFWAPNFHKVHIACNYSENRKWWSQTNKPVFVMSGIYKKIKISSIIKLTWFLPKAPFILLKMWSYVWYTVFITKAIIWYKILYEILMLSSPQKISYLSHALIKS